MRYPADRFEPDHFLNFVLLDPFVKAWKSMGLNDEDQRALEVAIMAHPQGPPVVPGTGGLRKLRFASPRSDRGKSGSVRVCYVYFEQHAVALLVTAYPKNTKDNLTATEKAAINKLIHEAEEYLRARSRYQ